MTQHLTFLMQMGDESANKCVLVQYQAIVKSWKEWREEGREGKKEGRMLATREKCFLSRKPGSKRGSGTCPENRSA